MTSRPIGLRLRLRQAVTAVLALLLSWSAGMASGAEVEPEPEPAVTGELVLGQDRDGAPVAGVTDTLIGPESVTVTDSGKRDAAAAAGKVRVQGLPVSAYDVEVAGVPEEYVLPTGSQPATVTADAVATLPVAVERRHDRGRCTLQRLTAYPAGTSAAGRTPGAGVCCERATKTKSGESPALSRNGEAAPTHTGVG